MTNNDSSAHAKRRVVLLSGMSGAGISTALKTLEDIGFEAVDNLRLDLIPDLVARGRDAPRPLAIAVDSRNVSFSMETFVALLNRLRQDGELGVDFVFLDCTDEMLQRRFTETRRRHPLAFDRPVVDGISGERAIMRALPDMADHVIDTSELSIHELRRLIANTYRDHSETGLTLSVMSFSFRHGVPREADMVFDARFLLNPHWVSDLRLLSGRDAPVADYIRNDTAYAPFMEHITDLLLPLLPRYQQEGKSYLTIAIGCTGGRHRSVFITEELATILAAHGFIVGISHRDLVDAKAQMVETRG